MKRVVKKVIKFQCDICRTEYDKASDAQKCENRSLEVKSFSNGDRVSNIEPRTCNASNQNYVFKGRVVKIVGPMASDYEYEVKWLGAEAKRVNGHVFQYQVKFKCPYCKEVYQQRYFDPELKKINR